MSPCFFSLFSVVCSQTRFLIFALYHPASFLMIPAFGSRLCELHSSLSQLSNQLSIHLLQPQYFRLKTFADNINLGRQILRRSLGFALDSLPLSRFMRDIFLQLSRATRSAARSIAVSTPPLPGLFILNVTRLPPVFSGLLRQNGRAADQQFAVYTPVNDHCLTLRSPRGPLPASASSRFKSEKRDHNRV